MLLITGFRGSTLKRCVRCKRSRRDLWLLVHKGNNQKHLGDSLASALILYPNVKRYGRYVMGVRFWRCTVYTSGVIGMDRAVTWSALSTWTRHGRPAST